MLFDSIRFDSIRDYEILYLFWEFIHILLSINSIKSALLSFDPVILDGVTLGSLIETTAVSHYWSTGTSNPGSQSAFGRDAGNIPTRFALF